MPTGNFLDIIILFGSLQGFIASFILFSRKKNLLNTLLAYILLIVSLACLNIYLFLVLTGDLPVIILILERLIPLIIIMPMGPLIYFYTQTSVGVKFHWKNSRLHFAPSLLEFIPSILFIVNTILYLINVKSSIETEQSILFNELFQKYMDVPRWFSTTVYLILSIQLIRKNTLAGKRKNWLKQFLVGFGIFQVMWLLHLIPYIIPSTSSWLLDTLSWYPIYLPLTVLVYWLGINGLIQSRGAGSTSNMNQSEYKEVMSTLDRIMKEERVYLDPNLSLSVVLDQTGFTQKSISSALNQYHGKSFNEYINEFRVEEVKRKLIDPSFDHLSITGIALESGFNSQATFQRAFKAVTGKTPKSFRTSSNSKE